MSARIDVKVYTTKTREIEGTDIRHNAEMSKRKAEPSHRRRSTADPRIEVLCEGQSRCRGV